MNSLLFFHANCWDVQFVETICKAVIIVTSIIVGGLFLMRIVKAIFEWKVDSNKCKNEEKFNYELQKSDKAKELVKDFYEATKDKEQKRDLHTTKELMEMYEKLMYGKIKETGNGEGSK